MPTDIGPPDYKTMLPPVIQRNYGKWRYHEILKPGVMMHVGETGEALYTVRAGSPRLLSTDHIREICDIAEKYCNGYLRFTSRNNIEFLLEDKAKIAPLLAELAQKKYPVGGTGTPYRISSTPRDGCTATRRPRTPPAPSRH